VRHQSSSTATKDTHGSTAASEAALATPLS
jgi:hypothetical protein